MTGMKKWKQNGITVAGGNESGDELNRLFRSDHGIYIDEEDDNPAMYIVLIQEIIV